MTAVLRHPAARAVASAAALALVATSVLGVDRSAAAYTDRATAGSDVFTTPGTSFVPQDTWLAGTATALQDDGSVAVWGFRGNGLSGTGVQSVGAADAISMVTLPTDGHPDGRRRAVRLAGVSLDNYYATDGAYTGIAALSDDGRVYTWGGTQANNVMGRPSTSVPYTRPGQVDIPGEVVDLVSSFGVFVALTSTGDVYTWGYAQGRGITGQGGNGASSPAPTRVLTGVHSVGAGGWNVWAVRGNTDPSDPLSGVLWWGWANAPGAFAGSPAGEPMTSRSQPTPTQAPVLSGYATDGCEAVGVVAGSDEDACSVQTLSGHYYGSQMLLRDGTLMAWGNVSEFGSGGTTVVAESAGPTAVQMPEGVTVAQVASSQDYVLLRGSDSLAYLYGRQSFGGGIDPGSGAVSTTNIRTPTPLTAVGPVRHVAGSGYSGLLQRSDGTMVLWGGTTMGGRANTYRLVRDSFGPTSTPDSIRPTTDLVMPGTERSAS